MALLALTQNHSLSTKSRLLRLTQFLDKKGIMTIGGRLSKADIQSSAKYQLILPGNYHVLQLFIQQYQETSYFSAEYVSSATR